ncbi:hypothetical protein VYU27_006516 [Nannochloropsis oceanica]
MGDNLRPYDIARSGIPVLPGDTLLIVPPSIREDMRCRICFDIVKEAKALRECLHRFCKDCGEKALRLSNETKTMKRTGAECPLCRTNIGSKRDLYDDPIFQELVALLYPHVAADEEAENKDMQARERKYEQALLRGQFKHIRGSPLPFSSSSLSTTPLPPIFSSVPFSPSNSGTTPPRLPYAPSQPPPATTTAAAAAAAAAASVGDSAISLGRIMTADSAAAAQDGEKGVEVEQQQQKMASIARKPESLFQICYVLLPYDPPPSSTAPSIPPSFVLPPLHGPKSSAPRLWRGPGDATMKSIKKGLAAHLHLDSPSHLELSVWVRMLSTALCLPPSLALSPPSSIPPSSPPPLVGEGDKVGSEEEKGGVEKEGEGEEGGGEGEGEGGGGKGRQHKKQKIDTGNRPEREEIKKNAGGKGGRRGGRREGYRIVLDDDLTLGDVVEHFWSMDVSEELCLFYSLRDQQMAGRFW